MTLAPKYVESIVREVMRRLHVEPDDAAPTADSTSLRLDERVVTLATLDGKLAGVRRLFVEEGTVVTPSARDLLKQNAVELTKGCANRDQIQSRILIASNKVYELPWGQRNRFSNTKLDCEVVCLPDVDSLVARVARGIPDTYRAAVLLSDRPHECLCLVNRHRPLRAALGLDAAMARCSMSQIDANVLVVGGSEVSDEIMTEFSQHVSQR